MKNFLKFITCNFGRFYAADPGDGGGAPPKNPASGGSGDPAGKSAADPGDQGDKQNGDDNSPGDLKALPDWAQKEMQKLRKENATTRAKSKTFEERLGKFENGFKAMFNDENDDLSPEQKIETLAQNNEEIFFRNSILELAVNHGIVGDGVDYLQFMISKQVDSLEENEELSDEAISAILTNVKTRFGGSASNNSSVDDSKGKGPDKGNGDITIDQFKKMNILERSNLYRTKPEIYNSLKAALGKSGGSLV